MKNITSKLFVLMSALALSLAVSARAEDAKPSPEAAAKKAEAAKKNLEKYDANHDGKLDDAEKAVMKADKDKMKAEHAGKKKEGEKH